MLTCLCFFLTLPLELAKYKIVENFTDKELVVHVSSNVRTQAVLLCVSLKF